MAVVMRAFVQEQFGDDAEWKAVHGIAAHLLAHLNEPDAQQSLADAKMPGQSIALVQATFAEFARDLGFVDESMVLFDSYENRALRPDYFLPVRDTGILLEVERGKTTINNMDLLDFWKCHHCKHANYLFLMVPQELRQNPSDVATAGVQHRGQADGFVLRSPELT
jgi:hypothetical protein